MNSTNVIIIVSDPWDVGEAVEWKPIRGELFETQGSEQSGKALVKFEKPITYQNTAYHYAVVSPRRRENPLAGLVGGNMVSCVLTGIADEQATSDNPLDISKWRGGLAFEGDVNTVAPLN